MKYKMFNNSLDSIINNATVKEIHYIIDTTNEIVLYERE